MKRVGELIRKIDQGPLWILGIVLVAINFVPYVLMGGGCVIPWHDQLDENILNYIIPARHCGEMVTEYSEMMERMSSTALEPYAVFFIPLYIILPFRDAFIIQYLVVFLIALYGMYFCIREITSSSIISIVIASFFSMLPLWPVYGTSLAGFPMAIYAIICLEKKKRLTIAYVILLFSGLTINLSLSGYAFLALWFLYVVYSILLKKKNVLLMALGFCGLVIEYVLVNSSLIADMIAGKSGYVSHREEFVLFAENFFATIRETLFSDVQHATALNKYLIIPIIILTVVCGICYRKLALEKQIIYNYTILILMVLLLIALFRAIMKTTPIIDFRNNASGVLHHFQIDRFNWLYPTLWWVEIALLIGVVWNLEDKKWLMSLAVLIVCLLPSYNLVKENSYLYMSVNQMNNGTGITGYITWDAYYSDDVMHQIDEKIGIEKETYRIAHIGMSPTPALAYGFYTIDGYSGSYPLDYKHRFRKVIAPEIEKVPEVASYFDQYGSRCYLFNSQSGTSFMNGKKANIHYEGLMFDWNEMYNLGCRYIFSAGEILDSDNIGLNYLGDFTSDTSFWRIWVYELCDNEQR